MTTPVEHIRKNSGWSVFEDGDLRAVVPNDDTIEHAIFAQNCLCQPKWDDNILIHNALDGRVKHEGGND